MKVLLIYPLAEFSKIKTKAQKDNLFILNTTIV